jgi:cytochrome c
MITLRKKATLVVSFLAFAVAAQATELPQAQVSKADIEKGKALISKSDCLACHKVDAKLVGPAYKDVAKKYKATPENMNKLADKIIKGGAGVWGQIPMSPHPTITEADAKKMVAYILSVK